MGELINLCFNSGNKEFIWITRSDDIWTNSHEKSRFSFNKASLKLAISYFIDSFYFTFGII